MPCGPNARPKEVLLMLCCTFLPAPSCSRMRGKQSWLMGRRRFRWWHSAFLLCACGLFGKCIDALAISCPTLNVTFSPGHDVALAKQRYRALQVEVIAAKNPCCSCRRRPDWQGSPLGRVKCIKNRPEPFRKESASKFQTQISSKVHELGPWSRCAAFVLYCKTNEDQDVSRAEAAPDSSTPHWSDTDLQGWSEAHSIAIAKCGTALVNCAWTFLRYIKKCSETKKRSFPKKCYNSSKSAHLVVSFCWAPPHVQTAGSPSILATYIDTITLFLGSRYLGSPQPTSFAAAASKSSNSLKIKFFWAWSQCASSPGSIN